MKSHLDKLITFIIPLFILIILGISQIYGKEYLKPVIILGGGVFVVVLMIFSFVYFLQKREERWVKNGDVHEKMSKKLDLLEKEVSQLKMDFNYCEKFNKLENEINYLRGKYERKKRPN